MGNPDGLFLTCKSNKVDFFFKKSKLLKNFPLVRSFYRSLAVEFIHYIVENLLQQFSDHLPGLLGFNNCSITLTCLEDRNYFIFGIRYCSSSRLLNEVILLQSKTTQLRICIESGTSMSLRLDLLTLSLKTESVFLTSRVAQRQVID